MVLFEWDDTYSVNVGEIDEQHQKLVGMLNDLHEAMERGKDKDTLQEILFGLFEYADEHFEVEEKYFEEFGYEDAVPHKKQHRTFITRVNNMKQGLASGSETRSMEVMEFMKTWLQGHIKGSDQKYSMCFNDNGLC
jgi:hemerythrin-like metal-binding protein